MRTFFTRAVSVVVCVKCNMSAKWTDREVFRLIDGRDPGAVRNFQVQQTCI